MNMRDIMGRVQGAAQLQAEDLLDHLGLQRKTSVGEQILMTVGIFGAGLLVGAGLGILFAPKSGRELRGDIGTRVNDLKQRAQDVGTRVSERLGRTATATGTTGYEEEIPISTPGSNARTGI